MCTEWESKPHLFVIIHHFHTIMKSKINEKSLVLCSLSTVSSSVSLNEVFSLTVHVFTWFERVSIMVILLNCVTLGMYQPCENIDCTSDRCQILQVDANTHIHTVFFFFCDHTVAIVTTQIYRSLPQNVSKAKQKKNHQLLSILQFCLLYSQHHSFTEPLVWLENLPFLFSGPLFFFFWQCSINKVYLVTQYHAYLIRGSKYICALRKHSQPCVNKSAHMHTQPYIFYTVCNTNKGRHIEFT